MTQKANALMLIKRGDIAIVVGVSTATILYGINDVLRSVTQETQRSVMRAIEERLYSSGMIRRSLVTKMDFIGFIFPKILKPIHARWPGLSKRLIAASLSGTGTSDPMVERACLAKLVNRKADGMSDIGWPE